MTKTTLPSTPKSDGVSSCDRLAIVTSVEGQEKGVNVGRETERSSSVEVVLRPALRLLGSKRGSARGRPHPVTVIDWSAWARSNTEVVSGSRPADAAARQQ